MKIFDLCLIVTVSMVDQLFTALTTNNILTRDFNLVGSLLMEGQDHSSYLARSVLVTCLEEVPRPGIIDERCWLFMRVLLETVTVCTH